MSSSRTSEPSQEDGIANTTTTTRHNALLGVVKKVLWTVGIVVSAVITLLGLLFPILLLTMGGKYDGHCPFVFQIPRYLFIFGFYDVFNVALVTYVIVAHTPDNGPYNPASLARSIFICNLAVFSVVQFIGFWFIYQHSPGAVSSVPTDDNYCNPVVFMFARVAAPVSIGLFFLYPCCLAVLVQRIVPRIRRHMGCGMDGERAPLISNSSVQAKA